uniref:Uncharacterized protein n=1 Tax=Moniliophthora roreri TaxID=221103 RepID=A0A0W0G5V5_MONRR
MKVTLKYRVVLENWPLGKIENLSKVSSAVAPLERALAMIKEGKCGFHRMEDGEYAKWKSAYLANLPNIQSEPQVDKNAIQRHSNGRRVQNDKNTTRGPREKNSKSAKTGGKGSKAKKRTAKAMEHDETSAPPACSPTPTSPTRSPTPPTCSPTSPTRSPTCSSTCSSTPLAQCLDQPQPQRLPSPFPDPSAIDPWILNTTPPPGCTNLNSGPADDVAGN